MVFPAQTKAAANAKPRVEVLNTGIGKVGTITVYVENSPKGFYKNSKIVKSLYLNSKKLTVKGIKWYGSTTASLLKITVPTFQAKAKDKVTVNFNHSSLKQAKLGFVVNKDASVSSVYENGKGDFIRIKNISLKNGTTLYYGKSYNITIDYVYGLYSQSNAEFKWEMGYKNEAAYGQVVSGTRISSFAKTGMTKGVHSGKVTVNITSGDVENLLVHFYPDEVIFYGYASKSNDRKNVLFNFPIRTHVYKTLQPNPAES